MAKETNPIKAAVDKVAEAVSEEKDPAADIPGRPTEQPPSLEEPTEPRAPLPPKPDQDKPASYTATGRPVEGLADSRSQESAYLTNAQGTRLPDSDHSLKAGPRGPVLLQDHHLREKIMHFDHERIPERVVHARGAGAHGVFKGYGTATSVTKAAFLRKDVETPTFTRFSTVAGSRGSMDTARDTRGFATKFYTSEGVYDLVGNNIPVFFIQDAIKFPDVVHSVKPHPDREIPQAQSAHDSFWDFLSLHTEALHHTIWFMADRGIPRSYRTMEGFGVHTWRLVNEGGETTLVKFHWKPKAGVHSLVWEEAQLVAGADPDFHRRDLADAIEAGAYPEWELGIQTFPDTPDQTFEGIDLLDPTKIVPEELAPVQPIGLLTLNANPSNYFAETEQVAFHPGHLVPGIDVTDDPLLAGRLFSYLDTQLTRLGGPNFAQVPINRTHAPVNDMLRDGMHQTAVHEGVAPYKPNSLDGGCPFFAGAEEGGYVEVPARVEASRRVREAPESFADHFSQPRLFWLSLSSVEREHTISAFTFELGKCYEDAIKERTLRALAEVDPYLCEQVAGGLGLPAPKATRELESPAPSPALSQLGGTWPTKGRVIGVIADDGSDLDVVRALRDEIFDGGMVPLVVGPTGGTLGASGDDPITVQRSFATARSIEFDALIVAGLPAAGDDANPSRDGKAWTGGADTAVDPRVSLMLNEAYRHAKALGALNVARPALDAAGVPVESLGVVVGDQGGTILREVVDLLGRHRVWDRFPTHA
ncbi:catalase [Nocardiopsis sp. NPDC055879]